MEIRGSMKLDYIFQVNVQREIRINEILNAKFYIRKFTDTLFQELS